MLDAVERPVAWSVATAIGDKVMSQIANGLPDMCSRVRNHRRLLVVQDMLAVRLHHVISSTCPPLQFRNQVGISRDWGTKGIWQASWCRNCGCGGAWLAVLRVEESESY